jgi:hypothetical protein
MRRLIWAPLLIVLILPSLTAATACQAQVQNTHRVNVPYFSDDIAWAESSIFWFGRVDPLGAPGRNYADVRVAYTAEELSIFINVEDYYLWYDRDETHTSDLTDYDTVAVYLDTAHNGRVSPQPDNFVFISAMCLYGCGDGSRHQREGRGTGSEWDMTWTADWTNGTWASWVGSPAYNNNDNEFDYGWWSYIHIPWSTVGLSGPPPEETVWGLGVILYDRDDLPPAGAVAPQTWPEDLDPDRPGTWAEMHFGLATFAPPKAVIEGTTVIRRGLGQSVVEDSWVGGGGNCTGGHEGNPEYDNYGTDGNLFIENQALIADFPCFSKSFLRFYLDPIPEDKVIISATLSLHHWSNARWDLAQPSLIWLLTVDGDWEENTLTWNNAPLARENLSTTWVDVITPENNPGWPGVRYEWDATQAVAEAYAAGEPVNIAMHTADTNFHSSKYFKSSDTGDWNEEGRPVLTVVWGQPGATLDKRAHPVAPNSGEAVTYTITMVGSGHPLTLTDSLPDGLSDPGPIQVTEGNVAYNTAQRRVEWTGTPGLGQPVTITFPVTVQVSGPVDLVNTATLTNDGLDTSTDTAVVIVDGLQVYLPTIMR